MKFKRNIISLVILSFIITNCGNNKQQTSISTESIIQESISTEQTTVFQTESIETNSTSKDDNIYYGATRL